MKLTDVINANDKSKLGSSKDRRKLLYDLGYSHFHMQGFKEDKYFETIAAIKNSVLDFCPPESNEERHAMLIQADDIAEDHEEYGWYEHNTEGLLMGSDVFFKFDETYTSPFELASCPSEMHLGAWGLINKDNRVMDKVHSEVGGSIRISYNWTQGKHVDVIGHLALAKYTKGTEKDIFAQDVVRQMHSR